MTYKAHSMRAARVIASRIADAIKEHGPMTVFDMAPHCGISVATATEIIALARSESETGEFPSFYISSYRQDEMKRRSIARVWDLGTNPDAPRPQVFLGRRSKTGDWRTSTLGRLFTAHLKRGAASVEMLARTYKCDHSSAGRLIRTMRNDRAVRIAHWDITRVPYVAHYVIADGKPNARRPRPKQARAQRANIQAAEIAKIRSVVTTILSPDDAANIATAYQAKAPGRIVIGRQTVYENGRVNWDAIEQFKEAA